MKVVLTWWRTKVHWFWRWSLYIELVVALFYVVEDIRGGFAWQTFLRKYPEFKYSSTETGVSPNPKFTLREADGAYSDKGMMIPGMRLSFFERRSEKSPKARLNFPLAPFRRSAQFYTDLLFHDAEDEQAAVQQILKLERDYYQVFDAQIDKGIAGNAIELEFDPIGETQLLNLIRFQYARSQAYAYLGEHEKSLECYFRLLDWMIYFDDGDSVKRSNDISTDLIWALQYIWEGLAEERFTAIQLERLQSKLSKLEPLRNAEVSSIREAQRRCQNLDAYKWSVAKRSQGFQELVEGFQDWGFDLRYATHTFLFALMPNGWVDLNKIRVCEVAMLHETPLTPPLLYDLRPKNILWGFDRSVHRFDARPTEAFLRSGITAIAMERHRFETGRYPDSLAMMVPGFLPEIPIDPFDSRTQLNSRWVTIQNRSCIRLDRTESMMGGFHALQSQKETWSGATPYQLGSVTTIILSID